MSWITDILTGGNNDDTAREQGNAGEDTADTGGADYGADK